MAEVGLKLAILLLLPSKPLAWLGTSNLRKGMVSYVGEEISRGKVMKVVNQLFHRTYVHTDNLQEMISEEVCLGNAVYLYTCIYTGAAQLTH